MLKNGRLDFNADFNTGFEIIFERQLWLHSLFELTAAFWEFQQWDLLAFKTDVKCFSLVAARCLACTTSKMAACVDAMRTCLRCTGGLCKL